jgi:hypothetical protein
MGEMRNTYKDLIGKPEGKIPLGGNSSGVKNNIKMDLNIKFI